MATKKNKPPVITVTDIPEDKKEKKTSVIRDIIDDLYSIHEMRFFTIREEESKMGTVMYIYKNGVWEPYGNKDAKDMITCKYPYIEMSWVEDAIKRIQHENTVSRDRLDANKSKITLKNGVWNLDTKKLESHSPDDYSTIQIPVKFDPNAICPTIDKFLSEVLSPKDIIVFWDLVGYCMYRHYSIKKMILMIGGNDTGKGTAIKLINAFIGQNNVLSTDINAFVKNPYAAANLYKKLVNTRGDISTLPIKDTGIYKTLTGDDWIDAFIKYIQNPRHFKNYAKMIFGMNDIPNIDEELLDKFVTRFHFMMFINHIPENQQDPNLLIKMTTEEELSGALNHAIEGLSRINGKTEFTYYLSKVEILALMGAYKSPLKSFISARLEQCVIDQITQKDVYENYVDYCKQNNIQVEEKRLFWIAFWKEFSKSKRDEIRDKIKINGNSIGILRGYRFKDLTQQESDEESGSTAQEPKKKDPIPKYPDIKEIMENPDINFDELTIMSQAEREEIAYWQEEAQKANDAAEAQHEEIMEQDIDVQRSKYYEKQQKEYEEGLEKQNEEEFEKQYEANIPEPEPEDVKICSKCDEIIKEGYGKNQDLCYNCNWQKEHPDTKKEAKHPVDCACPNCKEK